jgi:hypothetical protein
MLDLIHQLELLRQGLLPGAVLLLRAGLALWPGPGTHPVRGDHGHRAWERVLLIASWNIFFVFMNAILVGRGALSMRKWLAVIVCPLDTGCWKCVIRFLSQDNFIYCSL